jgi:hypothetical protein
MQTERTFYTQIITARAEYNFSPDVSWANLVQYDNESRIAGLQSRFRCIRRPGKDLFPVLNRGALGRRQSFRTEVRSSFRETAVHVQILRCADDDDDWDYCGSVVRSGPDVCLSNIQQVWTGAVTAMTEALVRQADSR